MGKLEDAVDELFRLPLAEFTGARNTLAAQLKKERRADEADFVKALAKPPISAWAVNQLYWNHREAFERLTSAGERFRKAQTSRVSGKVADMRGALDTRREALTHLVDLATALLRDAGHNPTQDTIRRITTTLEAMSAYASLPDAPRAGRLTQDVDPPGFESLASFVPSPGVKESKSVAPSTRPKPSATRQVEETRQSRIAAAKASLQDAKSVLSEARARAQTAEADYKKANAEAKDAEKHKLEAEQQLDKARAALQDATRRARNVAVEVEKATKALDDAKRDVEKTTKELESLFREPAL